MRKIFTTLTITALILTVSGLALAIHVGSEGTSDADGGRANGPSMWEYITKTRPYKEWDLWPGTEKMYKGREPHGAILTTYVTKGAKAVIDGKKGKFSMGNIIVKENYKPDKTLAAITVMYKANGYNPEAGDWYWAKFNPDGSVDKDGKVAGCINCHSDAADNDWVFTGSIK